MFINKNLGTNIYPLLVQVQEIITDTSAHGSDTDFVKDENFNCKSENQAYEESTDFSSGHLVNQGKSVF